MNDRRCALCGSELRDSGIMKKNICSVCGNIYDSGIECAKGHFVCESCDALDVLDFVEKYCVNCASEEPLGTALLLMRSPKFRMHGSEHIYLTVAVLLTAYYNRLKDFEAKRAKLADAKYRLSRMPEMLVNEYGMSSVGLAAGLFVALITNATPQTAREWKMCNLMAAEAYSSIARFNAVRCNKRDVFLVIVECLHFLREYFDQIFTHRGVDCEFTKTNSDCMGPSCPFYAPVFGSEELI